MKPRSIYNILFLFVIFVAAAAPHLEAQTQAVVMADDPFTDGSVLSTAGGDPLGLVWYQEGAALAVVDDQGGLGGGKALKFTPAKDFSRLYASFPAVPLDAEHDTLTVSFDYRLPDGAPDKKGGMRMGLYDSKGTPFTGQTGEKAWNDDVGYGIITDAGSAGGKNTNWFREDAGNGILGGPAPSQVANLPGEGPGSGPPPDKAKHTAVITLKRASGGELAFTFAVDDHVVLTATEAAAKILTHRFDEFALGFATEGNTPPLLFDNFKITATTKAPLANAPKPKAPPAFADPQFRTWTNAQGRTVVAAFAGFDDKNRTVKIKTKDGKEFALPLDSLSAEDAAFVQKAGPGTVLAWPPAAAKGWAADVPQTPAKKAAAKLETGHAVFRTLKTGHPRLVMLDEDWKRVEKNISADPLAKKLFEGVRAAGAEMLTASPLEHVLPDGKRLLMTSRAMLGRMYVLGTLHRLDGDAKWSDRARRELLNVCGFADWNPSHFLDVGEMAHGVAIGYDWFYDNLTEADRRTIEKALVEKALKPGLLVYAKEKGWHRTDINNWNQVCNGGLIIGALAIADKVKHETTEVLQHALASLSLAMPLYQPDGAWEEGPDYWAYATNYVISCSEALRTATGSDGGISAAQGFAGTGRFYSQCVGASGRTFNFADADSNGANQAALMWLGRRFSAPVFSSLPKSVIQAGGEISRNSWFGAAHELIWFDPAAAGEEWKQAPLDAVFRKIEVASLRAGWESGSWSISVKGGDNQFNHGHLDLGTFVLDALGERWAMDLGKDNYNVEGYFDKEGRWKYYRTGSAGHNTVTWGGSNQDVEGTGQVEMFESTPERGWAVLNLSKGYATKAKFMRRGVLLQRRPAPSILVQDELESRKEGQLIWAMHTQAKISANGATAQLTKGGKTLTATILAPKGAVFASDEINLAPPLLPTPDTRRLSVKVPAGKGVTTVAVRFTAPGDAAPSGPVQPLEKWGGRKVPR